jgi:hypothetical protein
LSCTAKHGAWSAHRAAAQPANIPTNQLTNQPTNQPHRADETEAAYVLSWYCIYVAFLAVNGMTEAYVQAVADEQEMRALNAWLGACSVLFVAIALGLVPRMGTSGLVCANCAVMLARSARNVWFAKSKRRSQANFMLDWRILVSFGLGWAVTTWSRQAVYFGQPGRRHQVGLHQAAGHVCIGVAVALGVVLVCWLVDRQVREFVLSLVSSGRHPTDDGSGKDE